VLDVRDVSVAFDSVPVLAGASLVVEDGEIVALLGPSGSGKSTLLRVVAGLVAPDTGSVHVAGCDVTAIPTHRRGVGMVFQDDQLFPHRDVAANIAFGLRMLGVATTARGARVEELLQLVGLAGFGSRAVTELSGGEAKRVALARSLAPSPSLLLLDEPLTGLDRELHDRLTGELRTILRTAGTTALLVTHDRSEAEAVADRVLTTSDLTTLRWRVVEVSAADTHPLRAAVLRTGTPSDAVVLPGDDASGVVHLGIRGDDGELVAVSTWLPAAPPPGAEAGEGGGIQLRMMATAPAVRGAGAGAALLEAGVARFFADGAGVVWANARDSALGFYTGHGFEVIGDGFVTESTGLPHHVIVRRRRA